MPRTYRHPVNRKMLEDAPLGAQIADRVTSFLGSWTFIVLQTIVVTIWVAGNVYLLFHFDPYPFILLNLAFSTQAAYAAPLILLAGNRAAKRDRLTLEHAAEETDKADRQNERLLRGSQEILERNGEILRHVESLEERILTLEERISAALAPGARPNRPNEREES
jgi:uncharacterized membrane protein